MMWAPSKTNKYGVVIYNWKGDIRCGLPLEIGDTVQILEENGGWYRGFSMRNPSAWGIFPACVVWPKPCSVRGSGVTALAEPLDDPLVSEIAAVLREWSRLWKKLYVEREHYRFGAVAKVMRELLSGRRALLVGTLTQDQTRALKLKLVAKLDWGNRKLGLELVPRRGAEVVDPDSMSIVELHKVHSESSERAAAWRGTLRRTGGSGTFNNIASSPSSAPVVQSYQLLCSMRDFGHTALGDEAELLLWLYDAKKCQPLSERFRVRVAKDGFNNYIDRLHTNCTIFADLGAGDLRRELWLVGTVVRVGRVLAGEGRRAGGAREPAAPPARRPLGAGALCLADLLAAARPPNHGRANDERDCTFKVYQCEEKDFHQLHDLIIKKQTNKYSILPGQPNYGIVLSLRLLSSTNNESTSPNVTMTSKRGFPDVIMPGDVRNDLYLTLERGEFERGGKSTAKNVLVTVSVHDSTGAILEGCIWGASGGNAASRYDSLVLYHNNSPAWSEQLRLAVPLDKFTTAHVRLEYRHCSTRDKGERKLFGFSFARLMEPSGATLQDGGHDLYVFKCDDPNRLASGSYLHLSSNARDIPPDISPTNLPAAPQFVRSSKEVVVVSTLLCSTKLTQNEDLLALLQWRAHPERVQDTLMRVLRLGDGLSCEELVKFLRDVLDALFALFSTEDGNSTPHSGTVFLVLVSICSLLDENRFQHFRPVLDAYIDEHFSAALVYKGLLSSVSHCATWAAASDAAESVRKCLRSLGRVFRLAAQSRRLFARASGGQYADSYRREVRTALLALQRLAAQPPGPTPDDHLLHAQVALMQSWAAVCAEAGAAEALGAAEAARAAAALLDAPPAPAPPALARARLQAARQLLHSPLSARPEARLILVTAACRHTRWHLIRRDELPASADILDNLVRLLWRADPGCADTDADVEVVCLTLLDVLVDTVLNLVGGNSSTLGLLVAGLLGVLQLLKPHHYSKLWHHYAPHPHDRKPLKDFLMRAFLLFRHLIEHEVFPPDWMILRVASCQVLLSALRELANPLLDRFLGDDPPQFDSQLWAGYLELGVALVTGAPAGGWVGSRLRPDVRAAAGDQILNVWAQLGGAQVLLVPGAVGALLEVTLSAALRRRALAALAALMAAERAAAGSARRTEAALVDKLDALVASDKLDDHYRRLFDAILMERMQEGGEGGRDAGAAFIGCVSRLLERLLDYRAVMQGAEHRDKRCACTVNLLNFYKNEIDRKEMYLRYVYRLHDLHIASENYVEAGCTLLLYADSLSWDSDSVEMDPEHPDTPECKRKEDLYYQVVDYFDKGKCWELGLPLLRKLSILYEDRCDLTRLAKLLRMRASFLDCILHQLRPEPEYFRVGFYGNGCPLFVRNKQFVYRGLEYERIGAFTARLQTEYPAAHVLMRNTPPDDSIVSADGQYIQICNVKPVPEPRQWPPGAPDQLRRFYAHNEVKTFLCDRPNHRPPIDKDNEFKSLWIERTTLETENSLPGILRWMEVKKRKTEDIAPVEYACETMVSVERELRTLIAQYTADPTLNINPFSMRLQGIIDANVQGGISKYEQAFLCGDAGAQAEESARRLRRLIGSQLAVLEAGLSLHETLAPHSVQPLHRRLVERFAQLKQNLGPGLARARRQTSESIINTPLPPLPVEKRSQSLQPSSYAYYEDPLYNRPIFSEEGLAANCLSSPMAGTPPPLPTKPRANRSPTRSPDTPTPTDNRDSMDCDTLELVRRRGRTSWGGETHSSMAMLHKSENAPPLPPRALGSDKRNSQENPPHLPRRTQRFPVAEPSTDGFVANNEHESRDSGILSSGTASFSDCSLTNSAGNNYTNSAMYDDYDLRLSKLSNNGDQMDKSYQKPNRAISMTSDPGDQENPPPIPPKGHSHLSGSFDSTSLNDNGSETNC